MECPDILGNRRTTGVAAVGTPTDGVFEDCVTDHAGNPVSDSDWYAINLDYGQTYRIALDFSAVPNGPDPTIQIFGRFGINDLRIDDAGNYFIQHTARFSGRHFIGVTQGGLPGDTNYTISASVLLQENTNSLQNITLWPGFAHMDQFETDADVDRFRVTLFAGKTYRIVLNGDASGVVDPTLQLTNITGDIVASSQGDTTRTSFAYKPSNTELFTVSASATSGTGDYSLIAFIEDKAALGHLTNSELNFDSSQVARITDDIGARGDIDWHKVYLNQGEIIRVTLVGSGVDALETPTLIVRDPNRDLLTTQFRRTPTSTNGLIKYYEAQESGYHYVVARSNISTFVGQYTASVEKVRTPLEKNNLFGRGDNPRLVTREGESISLHEIVDLQGLTPNQFEVFAPVELMRNGVPQLADQVHVIPGDELSMWQLDGVFNGQTDLFIRAKVSNSLSEWQKFPIIGIAAIEGLISSQTWDDSRVTYRFVGELPSYYGSGEISGFQSLWDTTVVRNRTTAALQSFTDAGTGLNFEFAEAGEAADINIFLASGLSGQAKSYLPGIARGGDIILNTDFYTDTSNLQNGSRAYFNLVRHIAHASGLNFLQGDSLSIAQSVMTSNGNSEGKYASTPGIIDLWSLGTVYGSTVYDPTATDPGTYQPVISAGNSITTIAVEALGILVDPVIHSDTFIDLRDGGRSYVSNAPFSTQEIFIGPGAQVYDAISSDGNDRVNGNALINRLSTGDGDDFLIGFESDDEMFGGNGDDIYIHYFGDGNDFVSDTGGEDTLCFFGRNDWHVDDLLEDYTFKLDGNQLTVDLTLDNGPTEGSVTIHNGVSNSSPIEKLELWHGTTLTSRISMVSILDQLADGETQRFQIGSGSDQFGLLATPV